jgi:hypothetical protein
MRGALLLFSPMMTSLKIGYAQKHIAEWPRSAKCCKGFSEVVNGDKLQPFNVVAFHLESRRIGHTGDR